MIVKALKAIAYAFTGKKEDGPHPLDGPTKRAQVEDKTQQPLPSLNPVDVGWPFPTSRPEEPPKPEVKPKAVPAKKTLKQMATGKRKAEAKKDQSKSKKTKK